MGSGRIGWYISEGSTRLSEGRGLELIECDVSLSGGLEEMLWMMVMRWPTVVTVVTVQA